MTTRLTILVKGLILIAVPLFFQLAFIGFVSQLRNEGMAAENWTIHTKDVMVQVQGCRSRLLSAHGAIQGLALTRDPSYERDWKAISAVLDREIDRLKVMVVDNPSQVEAASVIESKTDRFLDFMNEGRQLVQDGRMDAKLAASRRREAQGMLGSLEADFDRFLVTEQMLDEPRHERLRTSWKILDRILIGGVAISVLCTVGLALVFSRNISKRIANLTDNAIRLAEGKTLTPPIVGGDEISRLDRVFHEMAGTLAVAALREREHNGLIEQRAEELALVNGQLREKALENEMFVYSVSHDLRSPLVNLQGFSRELGMIGKDLGKLIDDDRIPEETRGRAKLLIGTDMAESIGFIQSAVTRLSSIIDALLRLSRAGRVEYRRQAVEVGPVVNRVVSALRGTIDERSATVVVGDLPPAQGDPAAIEQIFANLIGNAINYLDPKRPGRVEIAPEKSAESLAPGLVVYSVRDNGLGIPEKYKAKIFTAFQRLHGNVAKGEGVGLTLVRMVVERHNGRIWFESNPGEGTTFFVALPEVESGTEDEVAAKDDAGSLLASSKA